MFRISLTDVGRHFNHEWIFKDINYTFNSPQSYALLGGNGCGKSTLMQLLAAANTPSQGEIIYHYNQKIIPPDRVFAHLGWCAPAVALVDALTLSEFLTFHFSLKPLLPAYDTQKIIDILGLEKSKNKPLHLFSSGMQQRVRLATAIFCDVPLILLDEPCTNLDAAGVEWYQEITQKLSKNKLCIVASNQPHEYIFCTEKVNIEAWKP